MTRTVVLDDEAVHALRSVHHPKHRHALAHVQVVAHRRQRADAVRVVVPTAVRVEAGWVRTEPTAALVNRLLVGDAALDRGAANHAGLVATLGVSVADAHVGATIVAYADDGPVTVLTRDPADVRALAQSTPVTVVGV